MVDDFGQWVHEAPDYSAFTRRMAVWLKRSEVLTVREIAGLLDISEPAVWLWDHQFRKDGPDGLERTGPSGRHRSLFSKDEEAALVAAWNQTCAETPVKPTQKDFQTIVTEFTQRPVSRAFVYALLRRNVDAVAYDPKTGETIVVEVKSGLSREQQSPRDVLRDYATAYWIRVNNEKEAAFSRA